MAKKEMAVHEGNAYNKDFIAMMIPLLAMGVFYYGVRVLLMALVAVVTAKITDRLAGMLRGRKFDATENSSTVIALLIVMMMPATMYIRAVVMAVVAAVLVGKEAFGGYNSYPFNPSAVGFCVAALAWPKQIFSYPEHINWIGASTWTKEQWFNMITLKNINTAVSPAYMMRNHAIPNTSGTDIVLGNYGGGIGMTAALVILACGLYLFIKKRIPLSAPFCFLAASTILVFLFPRAPEGVYTWAPWSNMNMRVLSTLYEIGGGGYLFFAVFMVGEQGTLPKVRASRMVYGGLLGIATTLFCYFGAFEMGACFAFLLVNAISGYFDRAIAKHTAQKAAKKREVAEV